MHLVVLNDHLPVFEMNADNEAKVTGWVAGLDLVASFRDKLTEMRERQDEVASLSMNSSRYARRRAHRWQS